MTLRVPPQVRQRLFSTSSRTRTSLPSQFHSYNPPVPRLPINTPSAPKLGKIGRWYLPTMALIAVGMMYLPTNSSLLLSLPSRRTVTLDSANRQIGFAIANALDEHNRKQNQSMTQEERNMMLLEAYGERSSLEDMERAISGHTTRRAASQSEKNKLLLEAYGEKKSLRDVERALQVYEVQ